MFITPNYTNQYQQNFGATLKINNSKLNQLPDETVRFLEEEFPKATEALEGKVTYNAADKGMSEFRHRFSNGTNILVARVKSSEPKEQLLQKFVGFADGVLSKIDIYAKRKPIKDEISRLKIELETEGLREMRLWQDKRYIRIQALEEELRKLGEEDRLAKDKLVKIFGFRDIDCNGISSLLN